MTRCDTSRRPAPVVPTHLLAAPETFCTSGTSPTGTEPGVPGPRVHVIGAGNVGRAFLRLAASCGLKVVGVTDSSATVYRRTGLDAEALAAWKASGGAIRALRGAEAVPAALAIDLVEADVVVDTVPVDPRSPYDAILRGDSVLRRGAKLVLASKAALATAGAQWLRTAPESIGLNAVLGGTGRRLIAEHGVLSGANGVAIAGNATTTAILDTVERGGSVADGIDRARALGLCEPDPELDVAGTDAALKLAVVLTALRRAPVRPGDVVCRHLRSLDPDLVRTRARRGCTTRLVARWCAGDALRVDYEELDRCDPLAAPIDRAVYAYALGGGEVRLHVGAGLGPQATASALLVDVLDEARVRRIGGVA